MSTISLSVRSHDLLAGKFSVWRIYYSTVTRFESEDCTLDRNYIRFRTPFWKLLEDGHEPLSRSSRYDRVSNEFRIGRVKCET